jgi:hypothetical protein
MMIENTRACVGTSNSTYLGDFPLIGDLIVTEGIIYFFPVTKINRGSVFMRSFGLIAIVLNFIAEAAAVGDDIITNKLRQILRHSDSSKNAQTEIDDYIDLLTTYRRTKGTKANPAWGLINNSFVPLPARFVQNETTKLSFSPLGLFVVRDSNFGYTLNIAKPKRNILIEALQLGGFIE